MTDTSSLPDSVTRTIGSSGGKTASGISPDVHFDEIFSLACKVGHKNITILAYLNIYESPKIGEKQLVYRVPDWVRVYVTNFHSESVWLNFEFARTKHDLKNLRFPVAKGYHLISGLQITDQKVSVMIAIIEGDKKKDRLVQSLDILGKFEWD